MNIQQHRLPSQRDLTWWEWGVYKCRSVQRGHRAECLSWPCHQQLWTQILRQWWWQETIPNIFRGSVDHLTLLFGFRWHGHVVELIHQPYTIRRINNNENKCDISECKHVSATCYQLAEMLLTSCLTWVWRYTVSAFHCAEEWTSSGDTWEGMRSGPVGSECLESGRKTACRNYFTMSCFNVSNVYPWINKF